MRAIHELDPNVKHARKSTRKHIDYTRAYPFYNVQQKTYSGPVLRSIAGVAQENIYGFEVAVADSIV